MDSPFVRKALLQEAVNNKVRCLTCERRCLISNGGFGWCRTRHNHAGTLYTFIYGAVSSLSANPIEKKPFYHFYPGTYALTAGSYSCNFACPWCQNWSISKQVPPITKLKSQRNRPDSDHFGCPWCQNWSISKMPPPEKDGYLSPGQFVALTRETGCRGTSISFNEPTLSLEWSLDVFRLARKRGLYNTYVTNGYMTPEALSSLIEAGLDAMNVDVKGDAAAVRKYCKGIDVDKVWAACGLARSRGVHVEITTLVIPTVNDAEAALCGIAERIATDLGPVTPWHVSSYYPAYRFDAPPTPVRTLERAWEIGKEAGLAFVYLGNVPGHRYDNTYCPGCGTLLTQRLGFDVLLNVLRGGKCPECGEEIAGVWGK